MLSWKQAGEDHFVASVGSGRRRYRLAVERIPDAGWDWCVWAASDAGVSKYGLANSVDEAVTLSERSLSEIAPHASMTSAVGSGP